MMQQADRGQRASRKRATGEGSKQTPNAAPAHDVCVGKHGLQLRAAATNTAGCGGCCRFRGGCC